MSCDKMQDEENKGYTDVEVQRCIVIWDAMKSLEQSIQPLGFGETPEHIQARADYIHALLEVYRTMLTAKAWEK